MQSEADRLRAENARLRMQEENTRLRKSLNERINSDESRRRSEKFWFGLVMAIVAVCLVAKWFGVGPLAKKDYLKLNQPKANNRSESRPLLQMPESLVWNQEGQNTDVSRQEVLRKQHAAAVLKSGLEKHNAGRVNEMTEEELKAVLLNGIMLPVQKQLEAQLEADKRSWDQWSKESKERMRQPIKPQVPDDPFNVAPKFTYHND